MIWIARLLCPNGHVIAAGATEAGADESMAALARSFVAYLKDEFSDIACNTKCAYKLNMHSMIAEFEVYVEPTGHQTLEGAVAHVEEEAHQVLIQEFGWQSRN